MVSKEVFIGALFFVCAQLVAQDTSGSTNASEPASVAKTNASNTALLDAVKSGDSGSLRELLSKKVDPNAADADGSTGLHWAAYRADLESLEALTGAGADPNRANQFGSTPLLLAAKAPNSALVKVLLDKGADASRAAPDGDTPLMAASRAGRTATVELLLQHGANPNTAEKDGGQTALMMAAYENHLDTARLLLLKGANVNGRSADRLELVKDDRQSRTKPRKSREAVDIDNDGHRESMRIPIGGLTPLLFAVREGHLEMVRLLVDAGANVNDALPDGMSALVVAILNIRYEVAKFLIDNGADVNDKRYRVRPLHFALDMRALDWQALPRPVGWEPFSPESENLVLLLLQHGADVNARTDGTVPKREKGGLNFEAVDFSGQSPLLQSARVGDFKMMQILFDHGAKPCPSTDGGTSALMAAAGLGWNGGQTLGSEEDALSAVKWLVAHGCQVTGANRYGQTALHGAVYRGAQAIGQYLIQQGADLDAKDSVGRTPEVLAQGYVRYGMSASTQPEMAALLREARAKREVLNAKRQ
jgi:ankyrin repeat protein